MVTCGGEPRSAERRSSPHPEHPDELETRRRSVRRLGRVRLPLTLAHQPWATLYLLPDGRRLWCVRLWEVDRAVTRVVRTSTLRRYARESGLAKLARKLEELLARAGPE